MARILFLVVLAAVSGPLFGTVKNDDQCRAGVCVKIYENYSVARSDSFVYSKAGGGILFVYRFNSRQDIVVINFSEINGFPCHGENSDGEIYEIGNYYFSEGCINLNAHKSRTFSVHVKSVTRPPSRLLAKIDPTIWIRCEEVVGNCDSTTSAPLGNL